MLNYNEKYAIPEKCAIPKICIPPLIRIHVFIFYNPYSGNRQGMQMKDYAEQFIRLKNMEWVQVQMFDLTNESDADRGFAYLWELVEGNNQENQENENTLFLIASAGGDGSFVGVINKLMNMGIDIQEENIYFTVFPFGTGNDLSQALGWKRFIPYKETRNFQTFSRHLKNRLSRLEEMRQGRITYMDLWNVEILPRAGSGYVEKATKRHPVQTTGKFTRLMSNYAIFGVQGLVGAGFEKRRKGSRLWNVMEYTKNSFWRGVVNHVERVPEYIQSIRNNGVTYRLDMTDKRCRRMVEITFQNLPGIWGRKMKLWDICKPSPTVVTPVSKGTDWNSWNFSKMHDGKLDVYGIKSRLDYLLKQTKFYCRRSEICRVGQLSDSIVIDCVPEAQFHMMLDGEFYTLKDVKSISIDFVAQIQIVRGN